MTVSWSVSRGSAGARRRAGKPEGFSSNGLFSTKRSASKHKKSPSSSLPPPHPPPPPAMTSRLPPATFSPGQEKGGVWGRKEGKRERGGSRR